MFSFVKDIKFMEQLKELGFNQTYVMTVVDDHNFYSGKYEDNIYKFFRGNETIHGIISKPTGSKDEIININGEYKIYWTSIDNYMYYLIEI